MAIIGPSIAALSASAAASSATTAASAVMTTARLRRNRRGIDGTGYAPTVVFWTNTEVEPKSFTVTLTPAIQGYVEQLRCGGLHGETPENIIAQLIVDQLKALLEKGLIAR